MKFLLTLFGVLALLALTVSAFDKSDCSLPADAGPCRSRQESFYYDSDAKECKQFFYGGCRGNNNRFASVDECQAACN